MMYQQEADFVTVRKSFQPSHDFVVIGIAELLPASIPDFLKGINDNQLCVRVLPYKLLKLFIQARAKLLGADSKMQILRTVHPEHSI